MANWSDSIHTLLGRIENPLAYVLNGEERIYWLYLVWAFLIALVIFSRAAPGKTSILTFVRYAFPKSIYWAPSARVDYVFFFVDRILLGLLFLPPLATLAPALSEVMQNGLRATVPILQDTLPSNGFMVAVFTLVSILVADFFGFLAHTLQHRVPALWAFHKVHHSATVLTPATVYRMHPIDDILVGGFGLFGVVLVTALFQFLSAGPVAAVSVYGMNIVACAYLLLGSNLRHSHLFVSYGPVFSRIFISPAQHQIHHSQAPEHIDRNMGFIFALWDGLFGTLYIPKRREDLQFGLAHEDGSAYRSTARLFYAPFGELFRGRVGGKLAASLAMLTMLGLAYASVAAPAVDTGPDSVFMEDLTWTEVAARLARGDRTVLVPTAGQEQNGPHMTMGKHYYVVHHTADRVAREFGHTLVAPVITYVPEGDIEHPDGHMRFAGTISLPPEVFESVLESTARSLRVHGFTLIAFMGDSGGNQASQTKVAERLDAAWRDEGVRVVNLDQYYSNNGQMAWLVEEGIPAAEVGEHAGVRDTSELLYVHPSGVREKRLFAATHDAAAGVGGDPSRATAEIGKQMIALKVEAAVSQLRAIEGQTTDTPPEAAVGRRDEAEPGSEVPAALPG